MILTAIDSLPVYLVTDEPDAASPVQATCAILAERDSGLSQSEQSERLGATLRWELEWTALSGPAAGARRAAALRAYANQSCVAPFWPAAGLVSDAASAPFVGGLNITWEPDWSAWEIHSGAAEGEYSAAALTAPAIYGRFERLPDPSARTDSLSTAVYRLVERGPAAYAIAPRVATTTNGPTLHATAWPLLASHADWASPMASGGADMRVERSSIGYSREEVTAYQEQTPRSLGEFAFLGTAAEAMALVATFAAAGGVHGRLWWPAAHSEWSLAQDASSGSAVIVLESAPLEPLPAAVALRSASGALAARLVVSADGDEVTLSSTPGTLRAASTTVHPLFFGRFAGNALTFDWRDPSNVTARFRLVELPSEVALAEGETHGETIGPMPAKWWGYAVTNGATTWLYTSYESAVDAGELGTFVPAPIDHGDIVDEINLARHDVDLSVGYFDGSPFERSRVDPKSPRLTVAIYEGLVADPEEAEIVFTGQARSLAFAGAVCRCKLAGLTSLLDTRGPVELVSRNEWAPLYHPTTGLEPGDTSAAAQLVDISTDGTLVFVSDGGDTFPLTSVDYYRFGYAERTLEDGGKQRYTIVSHPAVTGEDPPEVPELGEVQDETTAWEAGITGAGGTLGPDSKAIANDLVIALKAKDYYSKIVYFLPLLGADLAAAMQPLIDPTAAGRPTTSGFIDADYAEDAGLQGNGSNKVAWLPFGPQDLGSSMNGGMGYWELATVWPGRTSSYCLAMGDSNGNIYGIAAHDLPDRRFRWGSSGSGAFESLSPSGRFLYGQRKSATLRELYVSGTLTATTTGSESPTVVATSREIGLMGRNEANAPGALLCHDGLCGCALLTDGTLSEDDVADLHSTLADRLVLMTGRLLNTRLRARVAGAVAVPPESYPESGWIVVPGSSGSYARAQAYGIEDAFGGFPRMPKTNPAMVPVKQETASGSKK